MYVYMTKVISISDEAYQELAKHKAGRSFTEVIIELAMNKKRPLSDFAGILTDEEGEKIIKTIYKERKMSSRRFTE